MLRRHTTADLFPAGFAAETEPLERDWSWRDWRQRLGREFSQMQIERDISEAAAPSW
ncbi:MAG: hypothetical protein AAF763_03315 [Pseudomonadota bacterium]